MYLRCHTSRERTPTWVNEFSPFALPARSYSAWLLVYFFDQTPRLLLISLFVFFFAAGRRFISLEYQRRRLDKVRISETVTIEHGYP